jgi:hypothetical protein
MKGEKYRDGLEVAAVLSKVAVTVSTPDPRYIEFAQDVARCLRALGVKPLIEQSAAGELDFCRLRAML